MNLYEALEQHDNGNITALEAVHAIFRFISEENVEEIVRVVSHHPEIHYCMAEMLGRLGALNDEGWERIRTLRIGGMMQETQENDTQLLRKGVGILNARKLMETENMTHRLTCRKGFGYALVVEHEGQEMFVYKTPDVGQMRLKIRAAEQLFGCKCFCEGFDG